MIILGVLAAAADAAANAVSVSTSVSAIDARNQTTSAYNTLVGDINRYETTVQDCNTLSCARGAASRAQTDVSSFTRRVDAIDYPNAAVGDAATLEDSAMGAQDTFGSLSQAQSTFAFSTLSAQARLRLNSVQSNYHQLVNELNTLS